MVLRHRQTIEEIDTLSRFAPRSDATSNHRPGGDTAEAIFHADICHIELIAHHSHGQRIGRLLYPQMLEHPCDPFLQADRRS